jgi:hypothetical protein
MLIASIICVSLAVLIITYFVWRDTSSRPSLFNGIFASLSLLISARLTIAGTQPDMAVGLPVLAGMLLLGRGIGTLLRSRREPQLQNAARLWLGGAFASLACAAAVYFRFTLP